METKRVVGRETEKDKYARIFEYGIGGAVGALQFEILNRHNKSPFEPPALDTKEYKNSVSEWLIAEFVMHEVGEEERTFEFRLRRTINLRRDHDARLEDGWKLYCGGIHLEDFLEVIQEDNIGVYSKRLWYLGINSGGYNPWPKREFVGSVEGCLKDYGGKMVIARLKKINGPIKIIFNEASDRSGGGMQVREIADPVPDFEVELIDPDTEKLIDSFTMPRD